MDQQPAVELIDYLAAIRRRRSLLAVIGLPIVAASWMLAAGLPDQFVSTGVIAFKDAAVSGSLPTDRPTGLASYQDLYVRGLANAVLNPAVLQQLLRQMPQLAHPGQTPAQAVREITDRTSVAPVRMTVLDPESGRDRMITPTFTVSFAAPDRQTAQHVAIWLTDAFVGGNRTGLRTRAAFATEFYRGAVQRSRARIEVLEHRLAQFKASHAGDLPELTKLNMSIMDQLQREIAGVTQQLAELNTDRAFMEQQLSATRASGADGPLISQLQAQYDAKLSSHQKNHPDMVELRAQIAGLRAAEPPAGADPRAGAARGGGQSDAGSTGVSVGLENQLKVLDARSAGLRQRQQELESKRAAIQGRLTQTPETERQYVGLLRDLELVRAQFTQLSNSEDSLKVTDAAIDSGRSDELRVTRAPSLPGRAAHPRRLAIAAVGVALAALVSLAALVVAEVLDGTVRGRRDIRVILSVFPLAVIPEIAVRSWHDRDRLLRIAATGGGVLTACLVLLSAARDFYWW